jgi:hypothetical protein
MINIEREYGIRKEPGICNNPVLSRTEVIETAPCDPKGRLPCRSICVVISG